MVSLAKKGATRLSCRCAPSDNPLLVLSPPSGTASVDESEPKSDSYFIGIVRHWGTLVRQTPAQAQCSPSASHLEDSQHPELRTQEKWSTQNRTTAHSVNTDTTDLLYVLHSRQQIRNNLHTPSALPQELTQHNTTRSKSRNKQSKLSNR